jgi:hypothetical protein
MMRSTWLSSVPHRLSLAYCLVAVYAAIWALGGAAARATAVTQAAGTEREGGGLEKDRLALRISQQQDGGVTLSSLRDRRSGRAWVEPGGELFRVEGTVDDRPFTLSGRSPWILVSASRIEEKHAPTLNLRLRAVGKPIVVALRCHLEPGSGPLDFSYTVAAVARAGHFPKVLVSAAESLSLPLAFGDATPTLHWVEKGRADIAGLLKHEQQLGPRANHVLLSSCGLDREAD